MKRKYLDALPEQLTNTEVIDVDERGVLVSRLLRGGETVVTHFILEDTSRPSGATLASRAIPIVDRSPPVFSGLSASGVLQAFSAVPDPAAFGGWGREVRPGGAGAVRDDQERGALRLWHLVTAGGSTTEELASLIGAPGTGDTATPTGGQSPFGFHVVPASEFVPNAPIPLAGFPSLATSKVVRFSGVGSWTVDDVWACERMALASVTVAEDAAGNRSRVDTLFEAEDTTPPRVLSLAVSDVTGGSASFSAQAVDAGDANLAEHGDPATGLPSSAATAIYAGLYETSTVVPGPMFSTGPEGFLVPVFDKDAAAFAGAPIGSFVGAVETVLLAGGTANFGAQGSPLKNFTAYTAFAVAVDTSSARNVSAVRKTEFATLDSSAPEITDFGVVQGASDYSFSVAPAARVADNLPGNLKLYLVLAGSSGLTHSQLAVAYGSGSMPAPARNEAFSEAARGGPIGLSSAKYWTGSMWADVTATAPTAPHLLTAYLVAYDAAVPANLSFRSATVAVKDVTAPTVADFAVVQGASDYSFSVSPATRVSDNRPGPLRVYLVLADTGGIVASQMHQPLAAIPGPAKNEAFSDAARSLAPALSSSKYFQWSTQTWVDTTATSPLSLSAYLVAYDGASPPNVNSSRLASAVPVADRDPPSIAAAVVTVSNVTTSGARVSWAGFSDNKGVSGYDVYRNATAALAGATKVGADLAASATFLDLAGLADNAQYFALVVAKDAAGLQSLPKASAAFTTLDGSPPTGGTVTASTPTVNGFTVGWSGFADNVGITAYEVWTNAANSFAGATKFGADLASTATSVPVTGLAQYTDYYAFVRAKDARNNLSAAVGSAVIRTLDGAAPTGGTVTVTDATTNGFTVGWSGFSDNVGITAYEVWTNAANSFAGATKFGADLASTATSVPVTGLAQYTDYYAFVRAKDARNNLSAAVGSVVIRTLDGAAPTVGIVTVTNATTNGFTVGWSGFSDNVGITAYEVWTNAANSFAGATKFGADLASTATSVPVTGLAQYTDYYAFVRAKDARNNLSAAVGSAVVKTLDGAAPSLAAFDATQNAGTYAFSATAGTVVDNAPGPLKLYLVMASAQQTTAQLQAIGKAALLAPAKNEAYAYAANAVAAVSATGLTTTQYWTGTAFADVSDTAPSAPHQLWGHLLVLDASGNAASARTAVAKTVADRTAPSLGSFSAGMADASSVDLNWSGVSDSRAGALSLIIGAYSAAIAVNASAITAANLEAGTGAGFVSKVTIADAVGTTYANYAAGLLSGSTYHFCAAAKDAAGNYSAVLSIENVQTSDVTAPTFAGALTAGPVTQDSVVLSWSGVSDNRDGSPDVVIAAFLTPQPGISALRVASFGTPAPHSRKTISNGASETTTTYAGLAGNATYHFYAVARDEEGNLSIVKSVENVLLSDATPPTFGTFTLGIVDATSVDLNWTGVSDNRDGAPDVIVAVYSTAQSNIEASQVASGSAPAPIQRKTIANGATTTTITFTDLSGSSTYHFYAVARDEAGLFSAVKSITNVLTTDDTAPTFSGALQSGLVDATSVQLTWSGVSDNRDGTPDIIIGAYSAASAITAENLRDGTGTGFVSKVTLPNAVGTTSYSYTTGLAGSSTYHFYAVARDEAGLFSAVKSLTNVQTTDVTAPTVTSFAVTQGAGAENYTFTTSGTTTRVDDNRAGNLKVYLVMADNAGISAAQMASVVSNAGMPSAAKQELFTDAMRLSAPILTTTRYYNWSGSTWADLNSAAPSSLTAYLAAYDGAAPANVVSVKVASAVAVADRTAPTITNFGATQGVSNYSFSLDAATRVRDNRDGPLKVYFFLASPAVADPGALAATHAANAAVAKNEGFGYSAASGAVAPPALTASKFWNGAAWTDVVEATPSLNAYLVVFDLAGLASSATVAKTVGDVTAPTISSFSVQQNAVPGSVAAETKHEFVADRPDTLDPRITFARASVATRVNSAGLIETVRANAPRFDHDPVTLERKGLLVEEARTNLLPQSSDLSDASWILRGATLITSENFPIFTDKSAFLLTGNGSSGEKYVYRTFTASSTTRTFSAFLRAGTGGFAQLFVGNDADAYANFNLGAGVVGSTGTSVSASTIQPWKNNWYRCTLTTASSAAFGFGMCLISSATSVRNESNNLATSIYVAGAQMEVGAFATSYIPTAAAAATRAGDFPSISGANFSSWYNATEGTFGAQFQTMYVTDAITRTVLSGNSDNSIIRLNANSGTVSSFAGGGNSLSSGTPTNGDLSKVHVGYANGIRVISVNGRNVLTHNTTLTPSTYGVMNTLHLGYLDADKIPFCGWIKSLVYYPKRLPDAVLPALSAADYAFSVPPTVTLSDGRIGPLRSYMVLASGAAMDSSALGSFVAARKADADFATALNEAVVYTTPGTAISAPYLFNDKFWNATANKWSRITETAPALTAHLAVYDSASNLRTATTANVPIADKTGPVISGFAVAQGASDYSFAVASATRVSDAKAGTLKVYLVLAGSPSLNNAQLAATLGAASFPATAKQEAFTDAMRAAAPALSSSAFWDASLATPAFVAISETAPASPHSLTAYLVARDAAGTTTSCACTPVRETNHYSFVVREKSSGVGGGNVAPELIAISAMGWNLSPSLSQSNIVRSRPGSGGALANLFDSDAATRADYDAGSYGVGDELFCIAAPESVSAFTVTYHRPIYRPGFQIFKNGVLVYTDASVATSADTPSPFAVTYDISGSYQTYTVADRTAPTTPAFSRASVATRVNEAGLIETVAADVLRMDHDPVTLAQKGLLVEEARTNLITRSNALTLWTNPNSNVTESSDYPVFTSGSVFRVSGVGALGFRGVNRPFTGSLTTRTMSAYLRRGTHNFAQILSTGVPPDGDFTVFVNFDLLTGVVGSVGAGVTAATIRPWRDGWFRCTLTTSISSGDAMGIFLVTSATATRGDINTLTTSIYVAGPQVEAGSYATSYIPTDATAVTRAADNAFGVTQGAAGYEFSATSGTISDGRPGPLRAYLVLTSQAYPASQIATAVLTPANVASMDANAKKESIAYPTGGQSLAISGLGLKSKTFWNGEAWAATSEAVPSLFASLVVYDAAGSSAVVGNARFFVADRTPPGFGTFSFEGVAGTTAQLSWTGVSDARPGSTSLIIGAYTSATAPTASAIDSGTGTGSYSKMTISNAAVTTTTSYPDLLGSGTYHFHAVAKDAAGNYSAVKTIGPVLTADATAPTISAFGATQGQGALNYSFSLDGATRVADNRDGTLKVYFFLATGAIGDAKAFVTTHRGNAAVAKNESFGYAAASGEVAVPALASVASFWNATLATPAFVAISETAPASPHSLTAYLVVLDAAGNAGSASVARTVADRTGPGFTTFTAGAATDTTVVLNWTGVSDARAGSTSLIVGAYASKSVVTAANLEAGGGAGAAAGFVSKKTLSAVAAGGSDTYSGSLVGSGTYHFYAVAKDAVGNYSAVMSVEDVLTRDVSAPTITDFGVVQGADNYTFTVATAARVSDNRAGTMKVYLVLAATSGLTLAQLKAAIDHVTAPVMPSTAKNEAFADANRANAIGLNSASYWTATNSWAPLSATAPANYVVHAYLVVYDAATPANGAFASVTNVTVANKTPPTIQSFGVLEGVREQPTVVLVSDAGAGSLDADNVTFSRASVATRVNSSGILETVAANVPRFDYAPSASPPGSLRGLLVEEARTNLIPRSEDVVTGGFWQAVNSTSTKYLSGSPSGGEYFAFVPNSTVSVKYWRCNVTYAANTTYTASVFAKAAHLSLLVVSCHTSSGARATLEANCSTSGALGLTSTLITQPTSVSRTAHASGWFRMTMTFTTTGTAGAGFIDIGAGTVVSVYLGSNTPALNVWGVQLEAGAFATSYIPTTGAAATRAGDVARTAAVAGAPPWLNPSAGTFGVSYWLIPPYLNAGQQYVLTGDSSATKSIVYVSAGTSGVARSIDGSSTVEVAGVDAKPGFDKPVNARAFASYSSTGGMAISARGSPAAATSTAPTAGYPATSSIHIGSLGSTGQICGWIRQVVYYPLRLSDADLATLSADNGTVQSTLSVSAPTRVSDDRDGNMRVFLVPADSALTSMSRLQLEAAIGNASMPAAARRTDFTVAMRASAPALTSQSYWTGTAWAALTAAVPAPLNAFLAAYDAASPENFASASTALSAVARSPPAISTALGVTQVAGSFAFALTSGTFSASVAGAMQAFLVLAQSRQTAAQLTTAVLSAANEASLDASAKNTSVTYPTAGAQVSAASLSPNLSAPRFWNGTGWAPVSATAPPAGTLFAYLVVRDSSGNASAGAVAYGASLAVKIPPTLSAITASAAVTTIGLATGTASSAVAGTLRLYHVAALSSLADMDLAAVVEAMAAGGRAPKGASVALANDGAAATYATYDNVLTSGNVYLHDNYGGTNQPFVVSSATSATATLSGVTYVVSMSRAQEYNDGVWKVFGRQLLSNGPRLSSTYAGSLTMEDLGLKAFGGSSTTATNVGNIAGEWVQVASSALVAYTRYGFSTGFSKYDNYGKWSLVARKTGDNTFTVLDRRQLSSAPVGTSGSFPEFPMGTAAGEFNEYRFILEALIGLSQGTAWFSNVWFGTTPTFGDVTVSPYTANAPVNVSGLRLSTRFAFAGSGVFRAIFGGESVHSYVVAQDANGERSLSKTATATSTAVILPIVSGLSVTQEADSYSFSVDFSAGKTIVSHAFPGSLKVYFFLSSVAITDPKTFAAERKGDAEVMKNESVAYTTTNTAIAVPSLGAAQAYRTASAWVPVDETTPKLNPTLFAHLVVTDSGGNAASQTISVAVLARAAQFYALGAAVIPEASSYVDAVTDASGTVYVCGVRNSRLVCVQGAPSNGTYAWSYMGKNGVEDSGTGINGTHAGDYACLTFATVGGVARPAIGWRGHSVPGSGYHRPQAWVWNGSSWVSANHSSNAIEHEAVHINEMCMLSPKTGNRDLHVVWSQGSLLRVRKYNGSSAWSALGGAELAVAGRYPRLDFGADGAALVCFADATGAPVVWRLDTDNAFKPITTFNIPVTSSGDLRVAVDDAGSVHAVFRDSSDGFVKAVVHRPATLSDVQLVDTGLASEGGVSDSCCRRNPVDGKVYVAYRDNPFSSNQVSVRTIQPGADAWVEGATGYLGGRGVVRNTSNARNSSTGLAAISGLAIDFDAQGRPYVAIVENSGSLYSNAGANRPVVYWLNGSGWDALGNSSVGSGGLFGTEAAVRNASSPGIAIDRTRNVVYASFVEAGLTCRGGGNGITVMRWRIGTSTAWELFGARGISNLTSTGSTSNPSVGVNQTSGAVYVAFRDTANAFGTVASHSGTGDWTETASGIGGTFSLPFPLEFSADGGLLVCFRDDNHSGGRNAGFLSVTQSQNYQRNVARVNVSTGTYEYLGGRGYMPCGDPLIGNRAASYDWQGHGNMVVGGSGEIYVAFVGVQAFNNSHHQTLIYRLDAGSKLWSRVQDSMGGMRVSGANHNYFSTVAWTPSGLYSVVRDDSVSSALEIRRFSNFAAAGAIIPATLGNVHTASAAQANFDAVVDASQRLLVAFEETNARTAFDGTRLSVKTYSGSAGWTAVHTNLSQERGQYPAFSRRDYGSTQFIAYVDGHLGNSASVARIGVPPDSMAATWEPHATSEVANYAAASSSNRTERPCLRRDADGALWVALVEGGRISVMKFADVWVYVGARQFCLGDSPSMAFDSANVPFVAVRDSSAGGRISVFSYDGEAWFRAGEPGVAALGDCQNPSLVIHKASGRVAVAFNANYAHEAVTGKAAASRVTAAAAGSSYWHTVQKSNAALGTATFCSMTRDASDNLFVAFRDGTYAGTGTSNAYSVVRVDAITRTTTFVGPRGMGGMVTAGSDMRHPKSLFLSPNGATIYLAIRRHGSGSQGHNRVSVYSCDVSGAAAAVSTRAWTELGGGPVEPQQETALNHVGSEYDYGACVDDAGSGKVFVAYQTNQGHPTTGHYGINVAQYDPGTKTWSLVGPQHASHFGNFVSNHHYRPSVACQAGVPHVCFRADGTRASKLQTMRWSGSEWTDHGTDVSVDAVSNTTVAVFSGTTMYVGYVSGADNYLNVYSRASGGAWAKLGGKVGEGVSGGQQTRVDNNVADIAVGSDGTPYAAYAQFYGVGAASPAVMYRFASSAWTRVDDASGRFAQSFSTTTHLSTCGTLSTGAPVVACVDPYHNNLATVRALSAPPAWFRTQDLRYISDAPSGNMSADVDDADGAMFAAFTDTHSTKTGSAFQLVSAMRSADGGSTWAYVGGRQGPAVSSNTLAHVVDYADCALSPVTRQLVVAFREQGSGAATHGVAQNRITVSAWNGTTWAYVGSRGALSRSNGTTDFVSVATNLTSGAPIVAYRSGPFANRCAVETFENGAWRVMVGSSGRAAIGQGAIYWPYVVAGPLNTVQLALTDNGWGNYVTVSSLRAPDTRAPKASSTLTASSEFSGGITISALDKLEDNKYVQSVEVLYGPSPTPSGSGTSAFVPTGESSAYISDLVPGQTYDAYVRVVDANSNQSVLSAGTLTVRSTGPTLSAFAPTRPLGSFLNPANSVSALAAVGTTADGNYWYEAGGEKACLYTAFSRAGEDGEVPVLVGRGSDDADWWKDSPLRPHLLTDKSASVLNRIVGRTGSAICRALASDAKAFSLLVNRAEVNDSWVYSGVNSGGANNASVSYTSAAISPVDGSLVVGVNEVGLSTGLHQISVLSTGASASGPLRNLGIEGLSAEIAYAPGNTHRYYASVAVDSAGRAIAVARDDAIGQAASAFRYESGAWRSLGKPGFTSGQAYYGRVAAGPGPVYYYAYWANQFSGNLYIDRYDTTEAAPQWRPWRRDAPAIRPHNAADAGFDMRVSPHDGAVWVASRNDLDAGKMNAVRMPAATATAAETYTLSTTGYYPALEFERGTNRPVAAFRDDATSQFLTVARLPAVGGTVEYLGARGFTGFAVTTSSVLFDEGGAPLVATKDNRNLLSVYRFSGTAWTLIYVQPSGTPAPSYMCSAVPRSAGQPSYMAFLLGDVLNVAVLGASRFDAVTGGGFSWNLFNSSSSRVAATVGRFSGPWAQSKNLDQYRSATTSWPDTVFADNDRRSLANYASDGTRGWASGQTVRTGTDTGRNGYGYQNVSVFLKCSTGSTGIPGKAVTGLVASPATGGLTVSWSSPETSAAGYRVAVAVYAWSAADATVDAVRNAIAGAAGVISAANVAIGTQRSFTGLFPGSSYKVAAVAISPTGTPSSTVSFVSRARTLDTGEAVLGGGAVYRVDVIENAYPGAFYWNRGHTGEFAAVLSGGAIAAAWCARKGDSGARSVFIQVADGANVSAPLELFGSGWDWMQPAACAIGTNRFAVSAVIRDPTNDRIYAGIQTKVVAYDPTARTLSVTRTFDRAMLNPQRAGAGAPALCAVSDDAFAVAWVDHYQTSYSQSCGRGCNRSGPQFQFRHSYEVFNAATGATLHYGSRHLLTTNDNYYASELATPGVAFASGTICMVYQHQNTVRAFGLDSTTYAQAFDVRVDATALASWTTKNSLPSVAIGRASNTFFFAWTANGRMHAAEIAATTGTHVVTEKVVVGGIERLLGPPSAIRKTDGTGMQVYAVRGATADATLEGWVLDTTLSVSSSYTVPYANIGVPALLAPDGLPATFLRKSDNTVVQVVQTATSVPASGVSGTYGLGIAIRPVVLPAAEVWWEVSSGNLRYYRDAANTDELIWVRSVTGFTGGTLAPGAITWNNQFSLFLASYNVATDSNWIEIPKITSNSKRQKAIDQIFAKTGSTLMSQFKTW
jgi:hypothetical protein